MLLNALQGSITESQYHSLHPVIYMDPYKFPLFHGFVDSNYVGHTVRIRSYIQPQGKCIRMLDSSIEVEVTDDDRNGDLNLLNLC